MSEAPSVAPTGVPGLDQILGGGLPRRGMVIVVGAPGTGKTVLVQQLAFAAATAGRSALYFSAFSESNERLIEHSRVFTFFDERLLAEKVQLFSLSSVVDEGADEIIDLVVQSVRQRHADLVILDGFLGLRALLRNEDEGGRFLYRLGAELSVLGAVLLVVLEGDPSASTLALDLAAADAVLALFLERECVGHRRYLEVIKRRGAAPLPGLHTLSIDARGLTCYPQFEMLVPRAAVPFDPAARAPFDLPELDAMLGGGLTQQTMTVVAGAPGTGKTLLGLQFLAAGAAHGEPGIFLGFHESRDQLLAKAAQHSIDLARLVERQQIQFLIEPPVALNPDVLAHRLLEAIRKGGAHRLVVDSMAELEGAVAGDRLREYAAALVASLRHHQVTALLTREVNPFGVEVDLSSLPISVLAENVLLLRYVIRRGELLRVLAVLKMRFSNHERALHEFTIGERGLTVLQRWTGEDGSLEEVGGAAPANRDVPQR
jgi:circadian clock protein KaiC